MPFLLLFFLQFFLFLTPLVPPLIFLSQVRHLLYFLPPLLLVDLLPLLAPSVPELLYIFAISQLDPVCEGTSSRVSLDIF